MHDDHDIDRRFLKKKKKKKKKKFRPTYPNFFGHVTGNTHTFLFGHIVTRLISDVHFNITGPKLTFKTYNYRHCDTSMSRELRSNRNLAR